jgi:hypothetical protein
MAYDISNEEYIAVLQTEVETLRRYYYKGPDAEGTGHFNTAIGVLEFRIKQLMSEVELQK